MPINDIVTELGDDLVTEDGSTILITEDSSAAIPGGPWQNLLLLGVGG